MFKPARRLCIACDELSSSSDSLVDMLAGSSLIGATFGVRRISYLGDWVDSSLMDMLAAHQCDTGLKGNRFTRKAVEGKWT